MTIQPTKRQRRRWWLVGVPTVLVLILAVVAELGFRPGIKVVVQNTGEAPIHSVVLHVTGNSYSLGDLAPGVSSEASVNSTGESDIAIEISDPTGTRQRLNVGVYIEPGYRGTVYVSIKDGLIDRMSHKIGLY